MAGIVDEHHITVGLYARQLRSAPIVFKPADRGKMRKAKLSEIEKRAAA
ncbi:hypothetical protein [Mesorhizobium kowhaii]|nr:hypothetical protein [Mesorhizobium kowhaii]